MKKKRFSILSVVLTAALSVIVTLGAVALAAWLLLGPSGLAITHGTAIIRTQFVGDYDETIMADSALDAMVDSLGDRWSYYADAQTYAELKERRSNTYVGIGVTITYEADGLHIQAVAPGGPAEKAGLLAGEIITAADGVDLTGENNSNATDYIQGEEGTVVVLRVLDASGVERRVEVRRERIQKDPVSAELLEEDIGYVALDNFYDGSADHVIGEIESLLEQGARSFVFDMRGNPGGYLEELEQLLDYLLPEGNIYQSGTASGPKRVIRSDAEHLDAPMAVLVNADSYSAAELFAAQLQESLGAPVVGMPTSGKGYSQLTFPLLGGRALNISTKTYYTGAGVSLIGKGITPNVVVELTGPEDNQLNAALELLK